MIDKQKQEFIGLFPAGGLAKRLGIVGSKEVLPVLDEKGNWQPVGKFLLDSFHAAGISTVYIILRAEKTDIKEVFGDGRTLGLKINYLNLECFWGTPFTLDQAWPLIQDKYVAVGFPDIILKPTSTFTLLKRQLLESTADVVLGLFKTERTEKSDMIELSKDGGVLQLHIKPEETNLNFTWVTAVWGPRFSKFMHQYLINQKPAYERDPGRREPFVGTVINAALEENFSIQGVIIPGGQILDIGTPDDLNIATSGQFFSPA